MNMGLRYVCTFVLVQLSVTRRRTLPALIRPTNKMSGHAKWALRVCRPKFVCVCLATPMLASFQHEMKSNDVFINSSLELFSSRCPYRRHLCIRSVENTDKNFITCNCGTLLCVSKSTQHDPWSDRRYVTTVVWSFVCRMEQFCFATSAINRLEWHHKS